MTTPRKIGGYAWKYEIGRAMGNIEHATSQITLILQQPNTGDNHRRIALALADLVAAQHSLHQLEEIANQWSTST